MTLTLSSPWVRYYHEVQAFFYGDNDIFVDYDDDTNVMSIYVNNEDKANIITELLGGTKEFGAVTLTINVIPANKKKKKLSAVSDVDTNDTILTKLHHLFDGNTNVVEITTSPIPMMNKQIYVLFQCKVLQYYSDDLGDLYGLESTLHEDVARDLFGDKLPGVYYCTAPVDMNSICKRYM
jgi:hypothetical protein